VLRFFSRSGTKVKLAYYELYGEEVVDLNSIAELTILKTAEALSASAASLRSASSVSPTSSGLSEIPPRKRLI